MLIAGGIGINSSSSSSSTLLASPSALHPRRARGKPYTVCSACKPTTVLPNGLEVCYASRYDVSFLYREIFEEQTYLQHGIHLAEGNVVVDVGGNIGFFALFTAAIIGPSGTVVSAEPIPTLYEKLCYNIISHKAWCLSQGETACDMVLLAVRCLNKQRYDCLLLKHKLAKYILYLLCHCNCTFCRSVCSGHCPSACGYWLWEGEDDAVHIFPCCCRSAYMPFHTLYVQNV